MNKLEELEKVNREVIECTACDLCFERNRTVFGEGDPDSDIMCILEAPGQREDELGRPLVGRSGKLFNTWMNEELEIERKDVYIANIMKCRPPNNRDPLGSEIIKCFSFLEKQIEIIKPKVLIVFGRIALQSFFKNKELRITHQRGNWMKYGDISVMPTYHPAFLLRQMSERNKNAIKYDLNLVKNKLKSD